MIRPDATDPVHPLIDCLRDNVVEYDRTGLDHESLFAGLALVGLLMRPDAVHRPDIQGLCDLAWEFGRRMCSPRPSPPPIPAEQLRQVTIATPSQASEDNGEDIPL